MSQNGTRPCRVLIAGNSEELRPLLDWLRQSEHFEVLEAQDGPEALLFLRQGIAEVAVLDLAGLRMDGVEILQEVRGLPNPVPIIFFSDSRDLYYAVEIMKAGAADYLLKPVLPQDLQDAIRKARAQAHGPPHAGVERQRSARSRHSERLEALGRLTSTIAHELNNQMTVMLGHSNLVLRRLTPADPLADHVREINRAAERAAALSRQLLDTSRKHEPAPRTIDLNLLVSGMVKMIERLVGRGIHVETTLGAPQAYIQADPAQMEQVILNLVLNARDAMPAGGTLTLATRNAVTSRRPHKPGTASPWRQQLLLAVSDTGCGMDAETRRHIFEPFFTTKAAGAGTGLGLTVVAKAVQQLGGSIEVASTLGEGTTFVLSLPQAPRGAEPAAETTGHDQEALHGSETILVVEDSEEVRSLLRQVLHLQGYLVLQAASSSQALQRCAEYGGTIDLLLTDIGLPCMSGTELAERLLSLRPDMKVLFMSGYSSPLPSRPAEGETHVAFIQKPFTWDKLAAKVREVLGKSAESRK